MTANTGSGLYIRKGHEGAFKTSESITASSNSNWMPVTCYDSSTSKLTEATAFKGSFGYWNGSFTKGSGDKAKDNDTMTYTAVTADETKDDSKDGDAYTAKGLIDSSDTSTEFGIYYHFELDYMITAGKSLKVTAKATAKKDGTETTASPNIAQATRVGILEASSVTTDETSKQMTGADYKDEGQEYLVAEKAGTDYNLEELKALGYEGTTEYKGETTEITRLDSTGATFNPASLNATTSDGAFAYGSLSIYVWFDGTDYSCTNAIFSQKVTFD